MGLTTFIFAGIVLFIILLILVYKTNKEKYKEKPFKSSFVALALIVLNWILFLSDFYVYLPEKIGDMIFTPIWVLVSIIGIISSFREYKNNLFFSLLILVLSVISIIMIMLTLLIGSM
ncbi:MAG: hypothetical protein ACTHW2_11920 [Tissierella sp.]|uniref:hypothetical protein n=1 Tax=Tissierella sp. TaxID=41274 RepID=UPI003F9A5D44